MEKKFAFIGVGNMGGALAQAVCRALGGEAVTAYDPSPERLKAVSEKTGCLRAISGSEAVRWADYVLLCVKPPLVSGVLGELAEALASPTDSGARRVLVSIAAGVPLSDISAALEGTKAQGIPAVRLLPNTPVAVGKGMIAMSASAQVTSEERAELVSALSCGGEVMEMAEELIDKATAVFSCSPAYVYMFIEALADGGVRCGVPRAMAQRLAAQAVLGSAAMVLETGEHPGQLKDAVCSPGGSTIAGVEALEDGGFRASVISAVRRAYEKTLDLA